MCIIYHEKHDADVLIAQTAVVSVRNNDTIMIGYDTDLLILLLQHAEMGAHELFVASAPEQSSNKNRIWCINQSKL